MYKNIIFDLDGTLWDSREEIINAWKTIYPSINVSVNQLNSLMGKTADEFGKFLFPNCSNKETLNKLAKLEKAEVSYLNLNGAKLFSGVIETIKELSIQHDLFIVSNCQSGYIESFLNYYHLTDYFKDIECNGNTNLSKSKNIDLIITRNNLDCHNTCYVGDTLTDLNAAYNSNIDFIWAKYGFGTNLDHPIFINNISELNKF